MSDPPKIKWKTYESYTCDWEDHGSYYVGFDKDSEGNRVAVALINKKAVEKLKLMRSEGRHEAGRGVEAGAESGAGEPVPEGGEGSL